MLSVQIHFAQYSIYYPSDYSLTCHIRLPRNVFLHVYITHTKNLRKWPFPFFSAVLSLLCQILRNRGTSQAGY